MKSSPLQKSQIAEVAEAGQAQGLHSQIKRQAKLPELPAEPPQFESRSKRLRKGATGKLHQFLTELEQESAPLKEGKKPHTGSLPGIDESLAFLQTLVEGSPDAIFIKDKSGRYLFANETFNSWMQQTGDAVLGKTADECFPARVVAKLTDTDAQVLADGRAFTEEVWLDDLEAGDSGTQRNLIVTKVPFRDKENRIIGLLGMARDNTLRKLMEDELRDATQFNEQVIAHAREGIVVYDRDLRYVVWNAFMEEFSGLPAHRLIGRHPLEVFPTIREQGMMDLIERALAGEFVNSPDALVNSAQGAKTVWARCLFGPLRDAKGEISGVIGLISDITEYKRTEARLRRSQQFNQQVIANASEGIVVYDSELRCMVWNPVLEDLSGLMGDDVLGRPILEIAPHWREAGLGVMLQQALQGDAVDAPDMLMGQEGNRWVSARYRPLYDNNEKVIGVIGILTDVTARRQAEDALRESQQFNQQVIDGSLEGIAVYDRDLNIAVWNPAMEALMEVHSAHVLGVNALTAFPHLRDTDSPDLWRRALDGETIQGREFQLQGKAKWVTASYGPLSNPRGEVVGVIVTMRDITARRQAELALEASQQFNQQIIANAREGIIVLDNTLHYLVWNPAMEAFTGLPATAVLGKTTPEIFPGLAEKGVLTRLQQALQGKSLTRYDYDYDFGQGVRSFSRLDASLRDERGNIIGVISTVSEVTARRKAEAELQESQQFSQEIIASAREGIVVYDRDLKIKVWNQAMEELSGVPGAQALGKEIYELFPHFRNTTVPLRLAEALNGQTAVSKDFQLQPSPTGNVAWISARYAPHRDSRGEIVGVIVTMRDITARREAEDKVRRSEERYREILATIQDGYFEIDFEGELLFCNEALCAICGVPPEDMSAPRKLGLLTPESEARLAEVFTQVRVTGTPVKTFEFEIRRRNGELRQLETSISLVMQAEGAACGYRGIVRDVTERKQAEQKLKERDDRFRALIENSNDCITLLSAKGKTLYVSPSHERVTGYQVSEVLNTPLTARVHPDDLPKIKQLSSDLLPGATITVEYRVRHRLGHYVWLEGRVTNQLNDPALQAFVVNSHDITARKVAEAESERAESRFRSLIAHSWEGISLHDRAGRITFASPSYTRLLGYEAADVLGSAQTSRIHPDDLPKLAVAREELLTTPGKQITIEHRVRHKDGTWRWLESRATNLLDDPAVGAVVVNFHDITERYESEHAVRQSEEKFRAIWDSALDAMLIVNDEMQYVDANPAACKLFGVTRAQLLTQTMADYVRSGRKDSARLSLSKLVEQGERKGHFQMRHKDHTLREIEYNARAHFLPGLHLSIMRDVTEQHRATEALRASEEQYRSLVNVLEEGILMLDSDGELLTCNESAERIFGARRDDLRERGLINPEWRAIREDGSPFPADEAPSSVTLRTSQPCLGVVLGVVRPDGDLRWLHTNSQPVFHQDTTELQAVVLSVTDITQSKNAETALRESESRFATTFDASPLAMTLIEQGSGKLVNVNQAWCQLTGFTAVEAIGHTAMELGLWETTERREDFLRQLALHGGACEQETQFRTRTGGLVLALIAARVITLGRQQYLITLTHDITARKHDEARLAESREQLRALSARLSNIREEERTAIAREIHDSLGQLLTGLKLDVAWLHKRLATASANKVIGEAQEALLRKTEGMADLLDNTIQTVRDLATQLRPGVLDTLGLTAAIEWQVQDFQKRTGIECEIWLCPEPKDLAKEKATALFRILQEILTNIIRHAEASRVVLHLLPAEGALLLSVADNGRGITTGNLRDAKSLGLLGMRERALMVGGEVNFEGAPDRGTTVTVKVPL